MARLRVLGLNHHPDRWAVVNAERTTLMIIEGRWRDGRHASSITTASFLHCCFLLHSACMQWAMATSFPGMRWKRR